MFKRSLVYLCSVPLALVAACGSPLPEDDLAEVAQSGINYNDISLNGINFNGINYNGFNYNGINYNGFNYNGINYNSSSAPALEGVYYSGLSLGGRDLTGARIEGPVLMATRSSDGQLLRGAELTGAVLGGRVRIGTDVVTVPLRIDRVETDAAGLQRYTVSMRSGTQWSPLCGLRSDGTPNRALALHNRWNESTGVQIADSSLFTLACEHAAIGKCVVWGYRPWTTAPECLGNDRVCKDQPLSAWHQACIRMVRADYCGDGKPHTRNGTPINVWDPLGIQNQDVTDWQLEAEWTQEGAVCIRHTRWERADSLAAETDLQYIQRVCPERLAINSRGKTCAETRSDFLTKNGLRDDLDERPLLRNQSVEGH